MGVGNFFGLLPDEMSGSRLYGVELDSISGRIAKKLYPNAEITVAGFETTDRRDFYDLAVGNVPFGNYKVSDKPYDKLGFSIHNYFFAKALDQVRPGGIVAFVTSRYTMDSKNPDARRYLAQRAELLGAIRLPNNAFKANAGTEVVSDIIFLQKREHPIEIEPEWVHLGLTPEGFRLNNYFAEHPEMVLGNLSVENTQYGREECTVEPIPGAELAEQLHQAVSRIHGQYQAAETVLAEGEDTQFKRLWQYIVTRTAKERSYYRYEDGRRVKHTIRPVLGEKAAHNGKVVYSLDFEVTPHQLRHTYITNLIHASVDPKTVQYLAGHESSKITMDIYAKVKYNQPDELGEVLKGAFEQWNTAG